MNLGFAAFGESTFGGIGDTGGTIVITGIGLSLSTGTVTASAGSIVLPTGLELTVSTGTDITFTISGSTGTLTGVPLTLSTGDENIITWNTIDPNTTSVWTPIDPAE